MGHWGPTSIFPILGCFAVGNELYVQNVTKLRRVNLDDYSVMTVRELAAGEYFRGIALAPNGLLFASVDMLDEGKLTRDIGGLKELRMDDDCRVIQVLDPITLQTTASASPSRS